MRCSLTRSTCKFTTEHTFALASETGVLRKATDSPDSKTVDDIALEVDCSMIIIKEGDVDIGESSHLAIAAKTIAY